MNVAICTAYGSPEVVEIREVDRPTPARGEVLVRVRATTVISADSRMRRADPALTRLVNGLLRPRRWARLGSTFSGEVVACGPGATRFTIGERVFGSTGMKLGAHAEYVCVQEVGAITRLAEQLRHEQGAALVFGGLASHFFLRRWKVRIVDHRRHRERVVGQPTGIGPSEPVRLEWPRTTHRVGQGEQAEA